MESNIPLPTDNIYKFYALFGLLLFVFSLAETFYMGHATNEVLFQTYLEQESIKQIANPTSFDQAKKIAADRRREIALSDRTFEQHALGALGGVATLLMAYGFWKWHRKIQPVQDEMAELQLKKLRFEVSQLPKPAPPSVAVEAPQEESLEAED